MKRVRAGGMLLALVAGLGPWVPPAAAAGTGPDAADDAVVALPPLLVEERATPLRWRIVTFPGYEMLSTCSDEVTREFARRCWELEQVLRVLVPDRLLGRATAPEMHILFNQDLRRARSQELMAEMLRRHETKRADDDTSLPRGGAGSAGASLPWLQRRMQFLPNLRLNDVDATAVFVAMREDAPGAFAFTLDPDRVRYLLERRVPALPEWFVAGMVGFYTQCAMTPERITIEPAGWLSEVETRALAADEFRPRELLPMAELLAGKRPRGGAEATPREQRWLAQCALFLRWAMVEDDGARREGLWTLVERLDREAPTEHLVRECLGVGFADLRDCLSDYLSRAVTQRAVVPVPKLGSLPELRIRTATDLEVACISGNWERLGVLYVRRNRPELGPAYLAQARRTLQRAYDTGERDPELLAIMALTECDAGNTAGARAYLEASARAGARRPRLYVELAKLRFDQEAAAAGEQNLTAAQAARVLELLRIAVAMEPPLPEAYIVMANVFARTEGPPAAEDLALLTEGAQRFPRIAPLVLRAVQLNVLHGRLEAAAELARIGAVHAPDEETRRRYVSALAKIAPVWPQN